MKFAHHLSILLFTIFFAESSFAAEMQNGLVLREYPRHREQKNGEAAYLDLEKFGKPIGEPRLVESLDPVEWEAERNMLAKGLLKIEKDGDYEFRTNSFYDRNELLLDGEIVCAYRDGDDEIVTVPLKKGFVEIIFLGFVESRGAAVVKWRPPGALELAPVPLSLLFNKENIQVPELQTNFKIGKIKVGEWARSGVIRRAPEGIDQMPAAKTEEVRVVAKDFVIEVYKNGKRIPDEDRKLLLDRFGASAEKINVKLKKGDWIVFHVANNRMRHGGSKYFSAVGIGRHGKHSFVSSPGSDQWSSCDSASDAGRFIEERNYGTESRGVPIAKPWEEGMKFSREFFGEGYIGEPIWGASSSTWIKYAVPN